MSGTRQLASPRSSEVCGSTIEEVDVAAMASWGTSITNTHRVKTDQYNDNNYFPKPPILWLNDTAARSLAS